MGEVLIGLGTSAVITVILFVFSIGLSYYYTPIILLIITSVYLITLFNTYHSFAFNRNINRRIKKLGIEKHIFNTIYVLEAECQISYLLDVLYVLYNYDVLLYANIGIIIAFVTSSVYVFIWRIKASK